MTEEKLRRANKRMNQEQAYKELIRGEHEVLGLVDEAGAPYTVPLNYCVQKQKIFFHAAQDGRKLLCIEVAGRKVLSRF